VTRSRWLLAALVVSLAVNLAVGGVVLGHVLRGPPGWRPGDPEGGPAHRLMRLLPPEARDTMRQSFEAAGPDIRARAKALREARDRVRDAIAAEPFDRARLDAALSDMRVHVDALQTAVQAAIADGVSKLPADVRRKVSEIRPPGPPEDGGLPPEPPPP
jgi:uncharacterized membrane protein